MTIRSLPLLALHAGASALVLALALAGPALARDLPGAPVLSLQERLTQARSDIQAANWVLALAGLLDAARDEPANADVHNLLGYSYRKQAKPDLPKAFEHYRLALRLDPTHRGAHEYIGEAYLMDGKPAEARRHLAELERLCGNRTCEEYGDLAGAIDRYRAPSR